MRIAADIQTAVGVLVLSLMFIRCDQGELGLTTPWGIRAQDYVRAFQAVDSWSSAAQHKFAEHFGDKDDEQDTPHEAEQPRKLQRKQNARD